MTLGESRAKLGQDWTCQAHEAARIAGVSKNTLLRWLRQGKVPEVARDRNGWRVFSAEDVERICAYARRITPPDAFSASAPPVGPAAPPRGQAAETGAEEAA